MTSDNAVGNHSSSALRGTGLLALWGNADPEHDDGFNDWYTHEHLPERMAVPGFLRARRYVADLPGPSPRWTYLTTYETESLHTLNSPEYLRALDTPTPATRKYVPLFGAMCRTACRTTFSVGRGGVGGTLAFLEFGPSADNPDELRDWLVNEYAPAALARSGTLGVHLAERDAEATAVRDRTESYRGVPTSSGRWLLLVEGAGVNLTDSRSTIERDVALLTTRGAEVGGHQLFRLLCVLED